MPKHPSSRNATPPAERRLSAVIVGGQPLVLDLLAAGLRLRGDVQVVAATSSVPAATAALAESPPELVIIDLAVAATKDLSGVVTAVSAMEPPPRVITLSADGTAVERMLRHSPAGRLRRQLHASLDPSAEVCDLHLEIDRVIESLGRRPAAAQPQKLLSPRELEVFARMGLGLMNAAIAAELGISQQTVETHRKSISRKLRASRTDLVRLAILHVAQHGDGPPAAAAGTNRRV